MSAISELEPKDFFGFFEELSHIPRPSGEEEKVSGWLAGFARDNGLEHYVDELGNVIIIREADPGREDSEPVILQGHMDMVCEKDPDCPKDMHVDGIDTELEGDLVTARGTTLGADDGVFICYALSFLSRKKASFPRLECVFTVSEETGMYGAERVDLSVLKGRRLINLDSEEEGVVITGCAGGANVELSLPVIRNEEISEGWTVVDITLSGLLGGHSGSDIDKNRENAVVVMDELLREISKQVDIRLMRMQGGGKSNAIPRECRVKAAVRREDADRLTESLKDAASGIKERYGENEKDMEFSFALSEPAEGFACDRVSTGKCLELIGKLPSGLQKMGPEIPETSLNLGICDLEVDTLKLTYSLRSQKRQGLDDLKEKMVFVAGSFGAGADITEKYSPWEPVASSDLQELLRETYRESTGKELRFTEIHAGLECGILSEKFPGLDAVSIGPDLWDVHTTRERMSVSSVRRVYGFLETFLEKC
ncbi:MAG: beta-Ala-His dipeptidase [Lachnospiraceae bacterium]|nr:beta-Ala-His dipeptidase [Lachnospiraceae bacterium]